ncbi:hypothetical protein ACOMHN_060880 [Nucella lapillus]
MRADLGENERPVFKPSVLDTENTEQGQAMIFKTVELNEGGYFNQRTGMFTVSQEGVYYFRVKTAKLSVFSEDEPLSSLMVGRERHCLVKQSCAGPLGRLITLFLTPGQKVWVKAVSGLNRYGTESVDFTRTFVPYPPLAYIGLKTLHSFQKNERKKNYQNRFGRKRETHPRFR